METRVGLEIGIGLQLGRDEKRDSGVSAGLVRVKSEELEKVSVSNQIQNGQGTHLVQVGREMISDPAGASIKSERPGRK